MDLRTRLESHPVATLKKEISKTNVKGYSKMKKAEVVNLMLKNKERFDHIKHAKAPPTKKLIKVKKEPEKEPKIKVKRLIKVKKDKLPKGEEHPAGIHIHINWKDGEKELKNFSSKKAGENAFNKIRENRKDDRDYSSMKLMDGKKVLDYSA